MALKRKFDQESTTTLLQALQKSHEENLPQKRETEDLLAFPSLEWLQDEDDQDLVPADSVNSCLQKALKMTLNFQSATAPSQPPLKRRRMGSGMLRSSGIHSSLFALAASTEEQDKIPASKKFRATPKINVPKLQRGVSKLGLGPMSLISKTSQVHGPSRALTLKCTVSPLA